MCGAHPIIRVNITFHKTEQEAIYSNSEKKEFKNRKTREKKNRHLLFIMFVEPVIINMRIPEILLSGDHVYMPQSA